MGRFIMTLYTICLVLYSANKEYRSFHFIFNFHLLQLRKANLSLYLYICIYIYIVYLFIYLFKDHYTGYKNQHKSCNTLWSCVIRKLKHGQEPSGEKTRKEINHFRCVGKTQKNVGETPKRIIPGKNTRSQVLPESPIHTHGAHQQDSNRGHRGGRRGKIHQSASPERWVKPYSYRNQVKCITLTLFWGCKTQFSQVQKFDPPTHKKNGTILTLFTNIQNIDRTYIVEFELTTRYKVFCH